MKKNMQYFLSFLLLKVKFMRLWNVCMYLFPLIFICFCTFFFYFSVVNFSLLSVFVFSFYLFIVVLFKIVGGCRCFRNSFHRLLSAFLQPYIFPLACFVWCSLASSCFPAYHPEHLCQTGSLLSVSSTFFLTVMWFFLLSSLQYNTWSISLTSSVKWVRSLAESG